LIGPDSGFPSKAVQSRGSKGLRTEFFDSGSPLPLPNFLWSVLSLFALMAEKYQDQYEHPAPVHPNTFPSQQPQYVSQPLPNPGMTAGAQVGGNRNALNKPVHGSGQRDWSYGLFGCFDACGTCLFSWCCPCFSYGQTQSRYRYLAAQGRPHPSGGELINSDCLVYGALMYCGCPCLIAMGGRKNIRERYLIEGSDGSDCLLHACCIPCTLTQESREITLEEQSLGGNQYKA